MNPNKYLFTISLLLIAYLLTSCGALFLRMMGVKAVKEVKVAEARAFLANFGVTDTVCYEAAPEAYASLMKSKAADSLIYTNAAQVVQNHIQPLQTICFDNRTGKAVFAYFNCIAQTNGTQLTWNKQGELTSFPPSAYTQLSYADTLITLQHIQPTIAAFGRKEVTWQAADKPYTVLVFYSLFMEKQAVNLIRETQTYLQTYLPNQCNVYYINFDNTFLALSR